MTNGDLSGLEIHIVDDQRTQLRCSQSSVQQHQYNRLVAVGTWPAHYKLLPFLSLRFAGIDTRLEDFFNVFFGKCFNRMFLKLRGSDFFSGIRELELHLQPSEKRSECYPHISDGFGGQRFGATVPTSRFIFGSQPGHVAGQVGRLNIRYLSISDVFQPMTKSELIGGNCALA